MISVFSITSNRDGKELSCEVKPSKDLKINYSAWCEMILKHMRHDGILEEVGE